MAPGSLPESNPAASAELKGVSVMDYKDSHLTCKPLSSPEEIKSFSFNENNTWMRIVGVSNPRLVQVIGESLDLHPLVLEDIMHTRQRAKLEEFDDYLFFAIPSLRYDEVKGETFFEQVTLVLRKDIVISFEETETNLFKSVEERIKNSVGRIRRMGNDYLAYALLDIVVDHYFLFLEKIGSAIDVLEESLLENPTREMLEKTHRLKKELLFIKKAVWPVREMISQFQRCENDILTEKTGVFIRDLHDHIIRVIDTVETYRDMTSSLMEIYLSSLSNRMNEVMKVLTIIATIFIPLTFIAGIYGMNFEYMPELKWAYGYPAVWTVMLVLGLGMTIHFWRKGWL